MRHVLILTFAALALATIQLLAADQGGTAKYPVQNNEYAARNYVEYFVQSVTPTASTVTFTTKTKSVLIYNEGPGSCVFNLGGGTPTATTNGRLLPIGMSYSADFTGTTVKVIGVAASPTVWIEGHH